MHRGIIRACGRVGLSLALSLTLVSFTPIGTSASPMRDPMTIRVNAATGSDVTGTGTLANPYATIEKAMTVATVYGDVIRIAPGTYYPPSTIDVPPGVQIIGAGLGRTVIWGVGGPSGPVFFIQGADANTRLEGVQIRGGGGIEGGAVQIIGALESDAPVISACEFYDNGVSQNGGAIYIDKGMYSFCRPLIFNSSFHGNEAAQSGGAIYVSGGANPYIYRCFFINNGASAVSTNGGGSIAITGAHARIHRCEIVNGDAPNGDGGGIAVINPDGMVEILQTRLAGNTADQGGGVWLYSAGYSTTFENCRIEDNISTGRGGGVRAYNASARIDGCTFTGNRGSGGASPGAIDIYDLNADQPVTVESSIFNNNGGDDVPPNSAFTDITITYSYLNETFTGMGNLTGTDPHFTQVSPYISRLALDSPCIDAGNPNSVLNSDFESLLRPKDGPDSDTVARVDMGHFEYGTTIGRLAGSDRYSTSVAAIGDRYNESPVAIIATGRNFPDALCASGLAGAFHAPVLLTDTHGIPDSVKNALTGQDIREAIIVGGTTVVGPEVETALIAMGIDVTRIAGTDRYATSRAVADYMAAVGSSLGHDLTRFCWVARGDAFPDALALAPLAALRDAPGPVLLTRPTSLPATVKGALVAYDYENALIAGSTSAVSADVYDEIAPEVTDIDRAEGADRYATAAAVAEWAMGADFTAGEFVGLAIGDNFPDALAGGAACGYERGVLLLTKKTALDTNAAGFLTHHTDALREIYIFGGAVVVSDDVITQCRQLVP